MVKTAIIEDSKAVANVYKSYLKNTEFEVNIFGSDVDEIENLVKENGFEIIIYPSYPKFQRACKIIARIKSDTQLASAIFILATTMQKSNLKSELNFKDIDGMIVKPFQQQDLYQSLSNSYYSHSRFLRKNPVAVVVDDSKAVQKVIATALTALNFIVKTASDGAEGLKLALKILPDLILTDVEMPVMDGFELCKKISLEPSIQNTPVIVISGNIDDAQFRKGFKSGAIDFLKKPVSQADLFSVIESVSFQNLTIPSGTALVASQDQTLSGIVIKILKSLNYHTNRCGTISALETYLTVAVPNIIILDLSKDDMKLDQCRYVRKLVKNRSPVIITVADEKDRSIMVQCFKYGADEFITKPFGRDELKARIKNHIKIKKLQDELIQKNMILESLAYRDKLTGLMNRRFFDETMKKELSRCEDNGVPLSFMMIDLDNFKQVNDKFGHAVGDTVLREFAAILKNNAEDKGIACRYGGEEFCIIFPELDLKDAMKIGEQIRYLCSIEYISEHKICQTISGGIASYPEISSKESIVIDADNFLYRAKQSGKNRIVSKKM